MTEYLDGLEGFEPTTVDVEVRPGLKVRVRGLGAADVMRAMTRYAPSLGALFGKVAQAKASGITVSPAEVKAAIFTMTSEFPELTSAIIALSTGKFSDAAVEGAGKLPLPVQIEILHTTFSLTFASEGDVKKFLASLTEAMVKVSGALTLIQSPSPIGTGA